MRSLLHVGTPAIYTLQQQSTHSTLLLHADGQDARSRAGSRHVAFGLQLHALAAMGDAGLRLKRMCAPRGLGRQHNLYGKDARMRAAFHVEGVTQTRLTRRRTPAARSRYGVAGRGP